MTVKALEQGCVGYRRYRIYHFASEEEGHSHWHLLS